MIFGGFLSGAGRFGLFSVSGFASSAGF